MASNVVVVGAGPGLGFSVAQKFAAEGFQVAMLARNAAKIEGLVEKIKMGDKTAKVVGIACDATDSASVKIAFEEVRKRMGTVDVLVFNAAGGFVWPKPKFLDIPPEKFTQSFEVNCTAAVSCVQEVLPGMLEKKRGTILFTGATASLRGSAGFATFATGQFAKRALAQSLAREFQPQGIHIAHVIVDGRIGSTEGPADVKLPQSLNPDAIAETYWHLYKQDPSTWSQEVDLRPAMENF